MSDCSHCSRPLIETPDAEGFGSTMLCRRHDYPDPALTIDALGGLEPEKPDHTAKRIPIRPKGTRSMRCSICSVNWPPNVGECPQCHEPTSPWKSDPDSMLDH